jgi:hypothetical protein
MKKTHLLAILTLAATPAFLHAQTTNYSDIVGYTTTTIKGRGSSGQPTFMSFVPVNLTKAPVFTGTAAAVGTSVNLNGANLTGSLGPTGGYPTHYLVIRSGSGEGYVSDIVSATSTTVTTVDDLSPVCPSATQVAIVPHTKLSDVLGTGASVLVAGGSAATSADNVLLVDSTGAFKTYYYKTGIGAGWKTAANGDATSIIVYPGESILVNRRQTADSAAIVQTGIVPPNSTKTVIEGSGKLTAVASGVPISITLTNLTSVLAGGSAASSADNVLVINPTTGKLDTLYYKTGIGSGWKTSANANADTTADLSNGFVVKRRSVTNAVFSQTKTW